MAFRAVDAGALYAKEKTQTQNIGCERCSRPTAVAASGKDDNPRVCLFMIAPQSAETPVSELCAVSTQLRRRRPKKKQQQQQQQQQLMRRCAPSRNLSRPEADGELRHRDVISGMTLTLAVRRAASPRARCRFCRRLSTRFGAKRFRKNEPTLHVRCIM
jgi:hypothetical protein